jgi:hypothetical protein
MSAARFNEHLAPLTPGDRVSAALTAARFNAMGKLAQEAAMGKHVRGGPGVRVRSGPQGTTISMSGRFRRGGGGGLVIHPFYIHEAGDYEGTIHAGTARGRIPTLSGEPIGEDGNDLSLTGSFWVYVKATFDLVFGAHFFLTSAEFTDADPLVIHTSGSPVVDDFDATLNTLITYRLIAHVVDGAVMRQQPTTTNLNVSVCDASDGTEEGRNVGAIWTP